MKPARILMSFLLALSMQIAHSAGTAVPSTLRIGTSASYPPLTFKADGKLQGVESDLGAAVANNLKVKVKFVELARDELIPALNDGRIDVIMSGMSVTDERSRQVLFTEPYMKIGQMALIRTADLIQWARPTALFAKGARVGVKAGTTGEAFARVDLPDAVITSFDSIEQGTDALVAGKIDIFIHDAPTIWRLTANTATEKAGLMGLYRPLTEEYLAWAVRKKDKALADALNGSLDTLKKDGTLSRAMGRWIPIQVKVN
ncbi:MAG: transporter substrate-binding domain-containing protein [Gammaproteobacteria bacterium]|nr:MAG: transporter substrate-binding domain-containing protein [Gammaproteobacteria bacterium]